MGEHFLSDKNYDDFLDAWSPLRRYCEGRGLGLLTCMNYENGQVETWIVCKDSDTYLGSLTFFEMLSIKPENFKEVIDEIEITGLFTI